MSEDLLVAHTGLVDAVMDRTYEAIDEEFCPITHELPESLPEGQELEILSSHKMSSEALDWLTFGKPPLEYLDACIEPESRVTGLLAFFKEQVTPFFNKLSNLSVDELSQKLKNLYDQAYHYDATTKTMDVGDDETSQTAKSELDIVIGAINERANRDNAFLEQVNVPQIEEIVALSSPNLDPIDRGLFYRRVNELATPEELAKEGMQRYLEWFKNYEGTKTLDQDSFWVSQIEFYQASVAHFGKDELYKRSAEFFPEGFVQQQLI